MHPLDQQILSVLRQAARPLKAKEIARHLSKATQGQVSKKEVNQRLYAAELGKLITQSEDYKWRLVETECDAPPRQAIEADEGTTTTDDEGVTENASVPEQEHVIEAHPSERILVEAPPGTGKTYVACSRVATLIRSGIKPSQILLISFTRTAVAEIRDRIATFLLNEADASRVRLSTIDAHAWHLRVGFEAEEVQRFGGTVDFDQNLERTIELLSSRDEQLCGFLYRLQHVLIDEAQDVVGIRARFLRALIACLDDSCGITVLADSDQAIYGFTNDEDDADEGAGSSFLELIRSGDLGAFRLMELTKNFRTSNPAILGLIEATRRTLHGANLEARERLEAMHDVVREGCPEAPGGSPNDLGGTQEVLVLYRRRAEVLMASSYLSGEGIEHRLRLSGLPTVVQPWIGRLLSCWTRASLARSDLEELWAERFIGHLFGDLQLEDAWRLLHRLAGDGARVELSQLRRVLSRSRPPVEICAPECGLRGPILGTIHASKGREAPRVRLMLPVPDNRESSTQQVEEECRVVYVGATRAIRRVEVGRGFGFKTSRTRGGRLYRRLPGKGIRAQVEIGLAGDLSLSAHAGWPDAEEVQESIAELSGTTQSLVTRATATTGWRHRLLASDSSGERCIGEMGDRLIRDVWVGSKRPSHEIRGVHMIGSTTIAVSDDEDVVLRAPFDRSRIFLAPVIKAFTTVYLRNGRI